jgi:hypothetical protein
MSTGGKGSKPRPLSVPRKKFDENWDRIFKKGNNAKTRSSRSSSSRSGSIG